MSELKKKLVKYYSPVVIWLALIFTVSSFSQLPPVNKSDFPIDKIAHFFEYGIFGYLLVRAIFFTVSTLDLGRSLMVAFGVAVFVSASDEFHQLFVPDRTASFYDLIADCAGIAVALLIFYRINVKRAART